MSKDNRHVTGIRLIEASIQRGGTSRTAVCLCGWIGPHRSTIELAADDAVQHESQTPTSQHLSPCPQHPKNRRLWGHMVCDCWAEQAARKR